MDVILVTSAIGFVVILSSSFTFYYSRYNEEYLSPEYKRFSSEFIEIVTILTTDDSILIKEGYDTFYFVRFYLLCIKIIGMFLPYGIFVLIPIDR
jgi:hypothetical protein